MSKLPLAVINTGMIASVGMNAPSACAAIRAKVAFPFQTRFVISSGELLLAHAVELERPWRGLEKLVQMAVSAISECLDDVPQGEWMNLPLLLCLAEQTRPGQFDELGQALLVAIQERLKVNFSSESCVIPHGRVSVAIAVRHARQLIYERNFGAAVVVAVDSLLSWPTLRSFDEQGRLLSQANSNGFIPGEGGCAVLLTRPAGGPQLCIEGLGLATEHSHVGSDEPLRGNGLTRAIEAALRDAGLEMHDMDFRVTDVSGESYYFKEATLALARSHRRRAEVFDVWHPAESIGEVGSVIGPVMLAVIDAAYRKGYAPGDAVLIHAANDAGERMAMVARYGAN